jgi:hypothetical protein
MNAPNATERGLTFFPIPRFDGPTMAFGAERKDFFDRRDLPDVPAKYRKAAMSLFYNGGDFPEFDPRVDRKLAMVATRAWLGSFAPAHESKEATVGYAFWVWSTAAAIDAALAKVVQP